MLTEEQIAEKASTETITSMRWWNDKLLSFTTTRPPGYSFLAGQYARLGLGDSASPAGPIWRAYSMTSASTEEELEFYGVIVDGGMFTSRLKELEVGSSILIEKQPYGFMTADRFNDGDDLWMFATGTGIGPYISMLREQPIWQKFRNLVLVHGVRRADELAYHEELERLQSAGPGPARLQFLKAVTREIAARALHGRITVLLQNGALEQAAELALTPDASRIMMCGNPQMIEDMRRMLHARGMRPQRRLTPGQFITENYW